MKGRRTCNVLKEIRQHIADQNDIPFETKACTFTGDCKGTCPACEAEVRYLEDALNKRRRLGKRVALTGIAACVMLSGCGNTAAPTDTPDPTASQTATQTTAQATTCTTDPEEIVLDGDVPYVVGEFDDVTLEGEPTWDDTLTTEEPLEDDELNHLNGYADEWSTYDELTGVMVDDIPKEATP